MSEGALRKRGIKEDWAGILYILVASSGFIVSLYDFVVIQNLNLRVNISALFGILLLIIGGILRITSRKALTKAGFGLVNSGRLQIVEDQQLVTDGVYQHVRHPLYLGEITRNLGFAIMLSSLVGLTVMLVGNVFLGFRLEREEKMLIEEFGHGYTEYRKRTKKLIPFIY
jgi:protein-S-isoprenylcysteine O-methyltransferase Ste14